MICIPPLDAMYVCFRPNLSAHLMTSAYCSSVKSTAGAFCFGTVPPSWLIPLYRLYRSITTCLVSNTTVCPSQTLLFVPEDLRAPPCENARSQLFRLRKTCVIVSVRIQIFIYHLRSQPIAGYSFSGASDLAARRNKSRTQRTKDFVSTFSTQS